MGKPRERIRTATDIPTVMITLGGKIYIDPTKKWPRLRYSTPWWGSGELRPEEPEVKLGVVYQAQSGCDLDRIIQGGGRVISRVHKRVDPFMLLNRA